MNEEQHSKFFEQNEHWKASNFSLNNSIYTQKTEEETEELNPQSDLKLNLYSNKNILQIKERETKIFSSKEWLRVLQGADVKNTPQFEIQASLRKGIPDKIRPRIWLWLSDISSKSKKKSMSEVYLKLKAMDSVWTNDISKDIPRTYATQEYFQAKDTQKRLYSVLKAYTNYDREIGYTQGMNFVVASLLFHMDPRNYQDPNCNPPPLRTVAYGLNTMEDLDFECNVFWLFVFINFDKNWRLVYKTGTPKALSLVQILEKRMETEVPEVYYHMEENDIGVQMSFDQAFITILLYYTPLNFSKRIIDMFLLVGEKIIIDVLIRMLAICKEEILSRDSPETLHAFLKREMVDFCFTKYAELCHTLIPQPQTEMFEA